MATFLKREKFNSWNAAGGLSERFAKNIQQFSRNREALGDWNPPKTESNLEKPTDTFKRIKSMSF